MKKYFLLSLLVILPVQIVLAQIEPVNDEETSSNENSLENGDGENKNEEVDENEELNILNQKFLEVKSSVSDSQDDLRKSINETSYLEVKLAEIKEDIISLEEQIQSFDDRIGQLESQVEQTNNKIEEINDTLAETKNNIEELDAEISYSLDQLTFVVQILYFESDKAGFFDNQDLQTVKLLLAEDNVESILEDAENISLLENYMQATLESLENSKRVLNELFDKFTVLKETKLELKSRLEKESNEIKIQRLAKENLLDATKGEEGIYLNLIEKSKTEEAMIRQEIVSQIAKYKEYRELIEAISGEEIIDDNSTILSWPIDPKQGISAYFQDSSYKAAIGIEHKAIDLPTYSGTSVGSAAPGVVFKVKGGDGNDYHYVLIGHSDGIMTLYGHMYDIFVEEGQTVERGEIIGLSGGTPGTRGSGYLTTGAHLHFEVIKDGVNVDPLIYLDQEKLGARYREDL